MPGQVFEARVLIPALSSTLCWIFSALLFAQWLARRKPYQIVWAVGLVAYGLAAGADALGSFAGWTEAMYRTWYLCGAIVAAAWLGLGEVYLYRTGAFGELVALSVFAGSIPAMIRGGRLLGAHADAPAQAAVTVGLIAIAAAGVLALVGWERPLLLGHVALALLVVGTLAAAVQVLSAPVDLSEAIDPATGVPRGAGFPETVRVLTPPFNIAGALAILFGAIYSAWDFWRRRASAERVLSAVLIAAGAFAPSLTSTLNRLGYTAAFYWGELLGVLLIFAGFLASSEIIARRGVARPAR
ncbi:MAG: hypothetical protein ACR2NO_09440 [Chloroflexota bacterium]